MADDGGRHGYDFSADTFFEQCEFSWLRDKQMAVIPVRNQLRTRTCSLFVVADCVSARHYIDSGELIPLAVQDMIDCYLVKYPNEQNTTEFDQFQCPTLGLKRCLKYAEDHGLSYECNYPFMGTRASCKLVKGRQKLKLIKSQFFGSTVRKTKDEINSLIKSCPIGGSVPFCKSLKDYTGQGIYPGPTAAEAAAAAKAGTDYWHAVMIIGYGHEGGIEYFLVKNSWGKEWGREGFGKIRRDVFHKFAYPVGVQKVVEN